MKKLEAIRLRAAQQAPDDVSLARADRVVLLEYLDVAVRALSHCDQPISKEALHHIGVKPQIQDLADPD